MEILQSWKHPGFSVFKGERIDPDDHEARQRVVDRICAIGKASAAKPRILLNPALRRTPALAIAKMRPSVSRRPSGLKKVLAESGSFGPLTRRAFEGC